MPGGRKEVGAPVDMFGVASFSAAPTPDAVGEEKEVNLTDLPYGGDGRWRISPGEEGGQWRIPSGGCIGCRGQRPAVEEERWSGEGDQPAQIRGGGGTKQRDEAEQVTQTHYVAAKVGNKGGARVWGGSTDFICHRGR